MMKDFLLGLFIVLAIITAFVEAGLFIYYSL